MSNKIMYETILGLNYSKTLHKRYTEIKELMRNALLQYTSFSLSDIVKNLDAYGIREVNYYTILVVIKEIVEECEAKNIPLNVDLNDMQITTSDLPF